MLQAAKYLTISQISNVIQSYDVYLIISTMMNNDVYTTISAKPINKGNNTSTAVSGTIASIPVGAYLTTSVNTPVPTIVSVPVTWKYLYLYLIRINILILFSLKHTSYLSFFLHQDILRPENFTLKSAQISDKKGLATKQRKLHTV